MANITAFSDDGVYVNDGYALTTKKLWFQEMGWQYSATGYGSKIPTVYMLKIGKISYRVYCRIYGNIGTTYIISKGKKYIVRDFYN